MYNWFVQTNNKQTKQELNKEKTMKKMVPIISVAVLLMCTVLWAQSSSPPTNLNVTQLSESVNQLTWDDDTAVNGETYNVYLSRSPITDVKAKGVVKIGRKVEEGTGVFTHTCYTPTDRGTVDYYYAVTSVDADGIENTDIIAGQNASQTALASKTIAVGKIALIESDVVIDGNIEEFKAHTTPFVINGERRVEGAAVWNWLEGVQNWTGNSDLSGNIYVMMDADNMYFGFEVFDDQMVQNFSGFGTWNGDAPEVNIGLYSLNNLEERHQTNYQRGAQPDYQFRLSIGDEVWMHVPWPGYSNEGPPNHNINYAEIVTLPFISQDGYFMEVRIPFDSLVTDAEMQNHPGGPDSLFHPEEGMLIPIDFTLNDADDPAVNYEGNFYYYWGDTTSFRPFVSPKWWAWTIIGDFNTLTSLGDEPGNGAVHHFSLQQNYPNPFNPTTVIRYQLGASGNAAVQVELNIYNILGQKVAQLVNEKQKAGNYQVNFDAGGLTSGVYFYILKAGNRRLVRKMTLLR